MRSESSVSMPEVSMLLLNELAQLTDLPGLLQLASDRSVVDILLNIKQTKDEHL